jgi:RHS repeat-associated protein
VVQSPDGTRFDFGVLPDGEGPAEAVAASVAALHSELPAGQGRVYRWLITRSSDAHGSTVYYRHDEHEGQRYLTDIYYTSPHGACGGLPDAEARRRCAAPLADYGRRIRLVYEARPDVLTSFASGWQVRTARRLRRVEMTSAEGAPGARTLVRRYHLGYDAGSYWSLLATVQLEGRPQSLDPLTGAMIGKSDVAESALGDAIVGTTLAPMRMTYTGQPVSLSLAAGFGGADATVHASPASPAHSVGPNADLFDVNSDGLADLVVTDPAHFQTGGGEPAAGVYWNGFVGPGAAPGAPGGFSAPVAMPMRSDLSLVMRLTNANISPMDVDGDGRGDLLHLPRSADTGYFTPVRTGDAAALSPAQQGWAWAYLDRHLPAIDADPRVDFAHDGERIRLFDVNNDHLVDIVRTTGTAIHVWLNLGWVPGGDGRYGQATWNAATSAWSLSTAPIETCLPVAGTPLDFADPEVRLGDMNGDGLTDIVKVRQGSVLYWPGRGEGAFGVGAADCPAGLAQNRHVQMATPPVEVSADLAGVHLADINADGVDDVVQVRYQDVDVWFNRGGAGFSARVRLAGTPYAPSFDTKVRLADIDGSGTVDIVYARAGAWQWVDPMGGQRPRLLASVENAVGARTELRYGSSVEDYLADLDDGAGYAWSDAGAGCDAKVQAATGECARRSGGSPVISTVVREVTTSDRFDALGLKASTTTTRYRYHDAYYEGIEQEVRGFGAAESIHVGDANSPTGIERVQMHQGRRAAAIASDRLADNPDEALKGAVYLSESFDEQGRYLGTTHTTYTLRRVVTGLSGVAVMHVYPSQTDRLVYDTGAFLPSGATLTLPSVIRADGVEHRSVRVRAAGYAHVRSTVDQVDGVGQIMLGTAHGRLRGELDEPVPDERVRTHGAYDNVGVAGSGWMWRAKRTSLDGHGDATDLNETMHTYSADGDLIGTITFVSQPVTLSFEGDAEAEGYGVAAPENLVSSSSFDAWGNPVATCAGGDVATFAGCLRISTIVYDPDHALTPVEQRVATRPVTGGFAWLVTTATWDRGFLLVRDVVDPNGETTSARVDGFGRPTLVRVPPASGCSSAWPSVRVDYFDPVNPVATPVARIRTTSFLSCLDAAQVLESHQYVDGLGRARAMLVTGPDTSSRRWVKSGIAELDGRGAVQRAYQASFTDVEPSDLGAVLARPFLIPRVQTSYDAFSRLVVSIAEDGATSQIVYHALSTDAYDPLDLAPGPFQGTPTTTRTDGHGRTIDVVLRNRKSGSGDIEYYRLFTRYRADGAVVHVERAQTTSDLPRSQTGIVAGRVVARTFSYDTVARRVATSDPDTDDRATGRTWRYLFNRVNDLVAVRDPRGCGQNFYYDLAGRPVGEVYVGCAEAQAHEAPPAALDWGVGLVETATPRAVDVLNVYDGYGGSWAPVPSTLEGYPADSGGVLGYLVATIDRGRRSVFAYDRRGNAIWEARQIALIPETSEDETTPERSVVYDEAHTYTRSSMFDHGNRARAILLPGDPDFAPGQVGPRVAGTISYDRRGLPRRTELLFIGGNAPVGVVDGALELGVATVETHTVVGHTEYTRDGLMEQVVLGDDLQGTRAPTTTTYGYDARRRPLQSQTVRAPTGSGLPGARPLSAVSVVHAQGFTWDAASNLVAIDDLRLADEWPAGHRPQSKTVLLDALYRVVGVEYEYTQDGGGRTGDDAASDWREAQLATKPIDPMRREPAPMVAALPPGRVASQVWEFDWLGNMTYSNDDAHAFYERSIGTVVNGADLSPAERPSALYVASDLSGPASDRGGWVEVAYGAGGNVVGMTVHGQCVDAASAVCADPGGPLLTRLATLRDGCVCEREQQYQYRWDEVNRLAEARRFDRSGGAGPFTLEVRQRYRYDAGNTRMVKQTIDSQDGEAIALYVFDGDLERRGLRRGADRYEAVEELGTETEYVVGGARVVWQQGTPAAGLDAAHRVTLAVPDLLGSTSAVIDLRSGELTQVGTFYPNGGRETLLGLDDADVPFDPVGFTGKEDDQEVGLVYFGERYLIPGLGRWASPDPLAIHALGGGEVLNSYHYVSGNILQTRDPIGLDENRIACEENDWRCTPPERSVTVYFASPDPDTGELTIEESMDAVIQSVDLNEHGLGDGMRSYVVEYKGGNGHLYTKEYSWSDIDWTDQDPTNYTVELGPGNVRIPSRITSISASRTLNTAWKIERDILGYADLGIALLSTFVGGMGGGLDDLARPATTMRSTKAPLAGKKTLTYKKPVVKTCWGSGCGTKAVCFAEGTIVQSAVGPRAIDEIGLGERVEPLSNGACRTTSVDASWVKIELSVPDPETPGDVIDIELLRPLEWVSATGAEPGLQIELSLPGMGIDGPATVESIESFAVPSWGEGCHVTGVFSHLSRDVMDVTFVGREAHLLVTSRHPLYSLDRGEWVAVGELRPGERLLSRDGFVVVERIVPSLVEQRVFNLEVEQEHAYLVSELEIHAHNDCVEISAVAPDWGSKGAHVHVGKTEVALKPGKDGTIVIKPVFSSTKGKKFRKAKKAVEKALKDPQFRKQLHEAAGRAIELLKNGDDMSVARAGELRFLQHALDKIK